MTIVLLWIGFLVFIGVMLALDLGVLHRESHVIREKEALLWTSFTVVLAFCFTGVIYYLYENQIGGLGIGQSRNYIQSDGSVAALAPPDHAGENEHHDPTSTTSDNKNLRRGDMRGLEAAMTFLSGYLLEQALSLDNIFVIALIFSYFQVPLIYQHRVLFWGILGALFMRAAMILAGAYLIEKFEWLHYFFGALLIYSAYKMATQDEEPDLENNALVRLARRFFPVSDHYDGERFFTTMNLRVEQVPIDSQGPEKPGGGTFPETAETVPTSGQVRAITPLFLALIVVESTDLLFAVDSIPAILALTSDPFIVFTSNVFAILALRSMYFALASLLERFHYLKVSLIALLALIGIKMIVQHFFKHAFTIPIWASLVAIVLILAAGFVGSLLFPKVERAHGDIEEKSSSDHPEPSPN